MQIASPRTATVRSATGVQNHGMSNERWPALPYEEWLDTYATLHMWTQIVGKVALAQAAPLNHGWAVALQVTPRGLATGILPHGARSFTIASTSSISSW